MVIAYHLIWTAYGQWLPNDPRGSGSKRITSDIIADLGEIHLGRKKIQPAGWVIEKFYEQAQSLIRYPVLAFNDAEIQIIAEAFRKKLKERPYTCYACAIMPDHVHLIIRKHRDLSEEMILQLQNVSRCALGAAGFGGGDHPIWTHGGWKVYLDNPSEVWRTIPYIEQNPIKEGRPEQEWDFVTPYDNWPQHKKQ